MNVLVFGNAEGSWQCYVSMLALLTRRICSCFDFVAVGSFDDAMAIVNHACGFHAGEGIITDKVWAITANSDVIMTVKDFNSSTPGRVYVFAYDSGALQRTMCDFGPSPGCLKFAVSASLSPDGAHLAVAEANNRMSGTSCCVLAFGSFSRCLVCTL